MHKPDVLERMRSDWNARAAEDANYFVAFGRRDQDDSEFFDTASDVVRAIRLDFARLRARDAALEIGCGPGRLMRPLSPHFGELHGVDVSDEMVRLARERLRNVHNAHPHHGSGADLAMFPGERFDFVYSFAVFQHIPSRDVVFRYLEEARRVLRTGGILKCQLNGLPPHARQYDTWNGVRISPDEVREFTRRHDFQLLALEGIWTHYMWITCRKMPDGWTASLRARKPDALASIRNISNAHTGEAAVPAAGPLAAMSLWIKRLPPDSDLNHLTVAADGRRCRLTYLGEPDRDSVAQLNAALPDGLRTGLVPVQVEWLDQAVSTPGWIRVIPAGPAVPRVWMVTDGIDLVSHNRIVTGSVKVTISEVEQPGEFRAAIDGGPVRDTEYFCADPLALRYEFNFRLPEGVAPGPHELRMKLGKREFAPVPLEVA
jgi:cyclopropane fatty-acyl-phospholipid synthase-like methyltransferase